METSVASDPAETGTTRATAQLPGLEIEIVHRRPSDRVEQISINLQATPSFAAFGRFLETANPVAFWMQAAQLAWQPWLAAARMMVPLQAAAAAPLQPRLPGASLSEGDDNA